MNSVERADRAVGRRTLLAGAAGAVAIGASVGAAPAGAHPGPWFALPDAGAFDHFVRNLRNGLVVTDLEVVTVTDTAITLAWATYRGPRPGLSAGLIRTEPADTEVWLARGDRPLRRVHHDRTPRGLHQVTIGGLAPGTDYRFECRSRGVRAVPGYVATGVAWATERRGTVTTLTPPPGRRVASIAILNDTHIGEDRSGIIVGDVPPPIVQQPGHPPYPEVMLAGALADVRRRGVDWLIVNGDCTAEARPAEVARFAELMDDYGVYGVDWHVTRGNHDRPHRSEHAGDDYAPAPPLPGSTDGHRDAWGARFVTRQRMWTHRIGRLRVIGVDSTRLDESGGRIDPAQLRAVDAELGRDPHRPTILFAHHPVPREAQYTNMSGPSFTLDDGDAQRLQRMLAATPGAFFMAAGHTHRTRRDTPDVPGRTDFLETVSTKDYPCGYTLLHLYTGGYVVNTHRPADAASLAWASRARWASFGLHPDYTFGARDHRDYVRRIDLSRLG